MAGAPAIEPVAEGVWLLRGWTPAVMNVYLLEDAGGVTLFDAGVDGMAPSILAAAETLGGLRRVVLGHAHVDHRGAAPALGVPVLCHADERYDAEGDGGLHYADLSGTTGPVAKLMRRLTGIWDGGPVAIDGVLHAGDRVADFEVIHLPGHAPGLIALWRAADRLALVSDAFYMLDLASAQPVPPKVPEPAINWDTALARASLRRLAELDPAAAWPGHLGPLRGPVRRVLLEAAEATDSVRFPPREAGESESP